MVNSPPSANPANDDSLIGVLRVFKKKLMQDFNVKIPARVISFDRDTGFASLQPLIGMVSTTGETVSRAPLARCLVAQLGGGGYMVNFPLNPGDMGMISACDTDIQLFLQGFKENVPSSGRQHSFEDSVFYPNVMTDFVIAEEDANNLVIQNLAGTVKVSWWSNLLKIIAPSVGIGGTPSINAILDVQSTTKAFKPPRMTTGQRDAIAAEEGMVIYNTTTHGLNVYNGTTWG